MAVPQVYVVHEFSVRPADVGAVDAALATIVGHIREDHPEVLTCDTFKQWIGSRPHRGYVWMEGFESLTTMDAGATSPTCSEVWEPVYRLAMEGSILRSVWLATPESLSLRR